VHIPEGYLSPATCAVLYGAAAPFWYVAVQRLQKLLTTRLVPLISIVSAFCFVIMMFNLPLPGGTTGHAVGMGIATIVLGPWGAVLAISVALILQAIFFGDGGILAIGANCFNMAIVGSFVAYFVYRFISGREPLTSRRRVIAGTVAGYLAINVAAFLAAIEFGIQPILFKDANGVPLYSFYPLSVAIPGMMIGHLTFAGLAEAIITGGVVAYLQRADPRLLAATAPGVEEGAVARAASGSRWRPLLIGLVLLVVLSPLGLIASGTAWGEWGADEVTAEQFGYHLRGMNEADRVALAGELDTLAAATSDRAVADELKSGGAALLDGDIQAATDRLDPQLAALQAADSKQYPHVASLASEVKEPSGLGKLADFWKAPIPDYAPGFMKNEVAGYIVSAVIGIALASGVAFVIGRVVARREATGGD
jgi:cobalt/nickel transport system permease protein